MPWSEAGEGGGAEAMAGSWGRAFAIDWRAGDKTGTNAALSLRRAKWPPAGGGGRSPSGSQVASASLGSQAGDFSAALDATVEGLRRSCLNGASPTAC
jgi:hypothetical protein